MTQTHPKVSIIGGGHTGITTALMLAQKAICDIIVLDLPQFEKPLCGKVLDIRQALTVSNIDANIVSTDEYQETADSDVIIITAGLPRRPGMTREDLVNSNADIMRTVIGNVTRYSTNSIILVLTNPVDAMTYEALRCSRYPKERVIGQSGVLDAARFRTLVARELQVPVKQVETIILGNHGMEMVPLLHHSFVDRLPLIKHLSPERLATIIDRTRNGGGEIVELLGNGSAYYAPAAALAQMTEAILLDQQQMLPAIAYLDGEYGYHDICFGVPTILGRRGVERIVELKLTEEEQAALHKSVITVQKTLQLLN